MASTTTTKPAAILIVPGAWHPPSVYHPLITALNGSPHFGTVTVATLPSLNNTVDPLAADCKADTIAVRKQLVALIEDGGGGGEDEGGGRDVLLLAHSYGGIPAGGAACGLSSTTRQRARARARARAGKGKNGGGGGGGGVVGLVYLSAFVVPEGKSLVEYLGGRHAPYCLVDQPSPGLCTAGNPSAVFFNDLPPSSQTTDSPTTTTTHLELASLLQPHAIHAFESPAPPQAWAAAAAAQPKADEEEGVEEGEEEYAGRLTFLRCTLDQALPPFLQDMFIEKSGVKWDVRDVVGGHNAWASMPGEVVKVLEDVLGDIV